MREQNVLTPQVLRVLTFGGYKCTQIMKHILCIFFQDVASSISTSTSCENRLWFSCCHISKGGILLILCGIDFLFARLPYSTSQIHVPYEHTKKTKLKLIIVQVSDLYFSVLLYFTHWFFSDVAYKGFSHGCYRSMLPCYFQIRSVALVESYQTNYMVMCSDKQVGRLEY